MTLIARPYQSDGVESARRTIRRGIRRIMLVAPTGSGKTCVAALIIGGAVSRGTHTLFFAHRREILNQTVAKLEDAGVPPEQIGVIAPNHPRRNPVALVQVASTQTLAFRAKPRAGLVFADEAHHATSATNTKILAAYPDAVHVGLTATPCRLDGKGFRDFYDELIIIATPSELIRQGHLVEPRVFSHPSRPNLKGVRTRAGDYDSGELATLMDQRAILGNIVEHWQRHAAGLRTIAFAVNIEHSKHITEAFNQACVPAEHLDGSTPAAERDAILGRLRSGKTLVVSNVDVLTEGTDIPAAKCAIAARPTKSLGLHIQILGRVLRPYPENPSLRAVILDHAGNCQEHGLPHEDRDWTLDGKNKRRKKTEDDAPSVRTCEQCFAVLTSETDVCPECGYVFPKRERVLRAVDGTLVEIQKNEEREKQRFRSSIQKLAVAHDHKRGWSIGKTNTELMRHFNWTQRKNMSLEQLQETQALLREWLKEAEAADPDNEVVEWAI